MAAIRFHLSDEAPERFRFAYAPLQEAVFSLHVLVEARHHPLHHGCMREMRKLPTDVRRELAACAFAFVGPLPDPLARFPERATASFEGLGALWRSPTAVVSSALEPLLRIRVDGSPETDAAMRQARDDPRGFLERLCVLLERYRDAVDDLRCGDAGVSARGFSIRS